MTASPSRAWLLPLVVALLAIAAPASAQRAPSPALDVLHYDLVLDLPDSGGTIDGRATLTVARADAGARELALDLAGLRVDSVLVDGRPAPFRRVGGTLDVSLPPARAGARDTLAVTVRYDGAPGDGLVFTREGWGVPWVAFGDNWPNRARYWIPSVDHPSDKATVTWTVTAPADRRVVANGVLEEETRLGAPGTAAGARALTRWRESRPIPTYTMVIAVAPLTYYSLGEAACGRAEEPGCVPQAAYVDPAVRDFLPGPFERATDIVDYFSALVAPFPYEKLAHLESSTRFGGMENATAIFYADAPYRRRAMGPGVVAHETAHQWFGNSVTEAEWGHLWLSEGFATYFEALWTRHAFGDSAFRAEMAGSRDAVLRSPVTWARPVVDTAQANLMALLNTNSYQKGGWVLHMLRGLLGDSAFVRGVRAYYGAHRHGNALTDDLRRAMEGASGRELGWFFDQWLRRPGAPELSACWRYDRRTPRVLLEITQGARVPPYRFPLTVELTAADGTRRRATVEVPAQRVARLALPLATPPAAVRLDPDVELLADLGSGAAAACAP